MKNAMIPEQKLVPANIIAEKIKKDFSDMKTWRIFVPIITETSVGAALVNMKGA